MTENKSKRTIGLIVFALIFSLFLYISRAEYNNAIEEDKSSVIKDLNIIRAHIEGHIKLATFYYLKD